MHGSVHLALEIACGLHRKAAITLQRSVWEQLVMERIAEFTERVLVSEDLHLACRHGLPQPSLVMFFGQLNMRAERWVWTMQHTRAAAQRDSAPGGHQWHRQEHLSRCHMHTQASHAFWTDSLSWVMCRPPVRGGQVGCLLAWH